MTIFRRIIAAAPTTVAAVLLLCAITLFVKAYTGIRHDSILYFGQALLFLHPSEFSSDLFFAYGSQAQFTFFPRLMAPALAVFTPEHLSICLTLAGLVAFLAASYALLRTLVAERHRYWALIALIGMPAGYGAFGVFSYAEPFATGRTFAEPLVLLALLFLLRERLVLAAVLLAAAASLHPLQAAPGIVLAWVYLATKRPLLWHLAWLTAPAIALAYLGVGPFPQLLQIHDAEWLSWITEPNRHVFLTQWPLSAWTSLATDVFILWIGRRMADAKFAALMRAALLGGLICFAAALVLGDVLHLALATGLQLWRFHWLMHWLAMASIPIVLLRLWTSESDRLHILMFIAVAVLGAPVGKFGAPPAALICIALYFAWPGLRDKLRPAYHKALMFGLALAILLAYFKFAYVVMLGHTVDVRHVLYGLIIVTLHPLPFAATMGLGAATWARAGTWARNALLLLLCITLLISASLWDRRSNWSKYVEQSTPKSSPFSVALRPGSQVYWIGELLTPWLVLRRASYWSGHQEAGLLFNRGTAQEANRREKIFGLLEFQGSICSLLNNLSNDQEKCAPDEEVVRGICMEAGHQLDYIVLPQKLKYGVLGTWTIPKLDSLDRPVTYYLYQCGDFPTSHSGTARTEEN